MSITLVRANEEESKLFKSYASLHGISLSEAYKKALTEKIEDEFDLSDMERSIKRIEKDSKTYSLDDLRKQYDL